MSREPAQWGGYRYKENRGSRVLFDCHSSWTDSPLGSSSSSDSLAVRLQGLCTLSFIHRQADSFSAQKSCLERDLPGHPGKGAPHSHTVLFHLLCGAPHHLMGSLSAFCSWSISRRIGTLSVLFSTMPWHPEQSLARSKHLSQTR